jgi:hypothetical protein
LSCKLVFAFTEFHWQCDIFGVKRPPESFIRDYEAFRERLDWANAGGIREDVVRAQAVYIEMRDFLDPWQGKIGVAAMEAGLAELRPIVDRIAALLETEYLKALADLLERRHTVLIHPLIFEGGVALLELMKVAPEKMRPGLEKIFRESMGYDFDAERFYRENEADFEIYDTEYAQAFAKMEVTWPDRFSAETRARLARAEIEEINAWKVEVGRQLALEH